MADVKEKVGVLTDEISTAGRPIYKTPEGEMVSEKSTTFKYKGSWINIPTIHNGYSYDEEELRIMLDNNIIKPTSTHKNLKAAEKAAKERSPTLRGFASGGSVEDQTQKAFSLSGSNVGKVRGLGPKDPNYKGTGYGPLIAGNIAEVASVIADDPVGFAKDTAVGVYEEGKDFLSRPIDYSKEVVQEVVESAADLKNKDINARLQEKYGVNFEQATPEQVDDIRQSILSDSMTASGLIPAAGLVGAGTKAIVSNVEVDPNRMGSMLGAFRRKEKPDTELAFPSPRLEQKTDTSFSYPTQTINLSGPISSYVETMNIPKKGITANNFLKEIRNNLNVPVRVFPDSFVDSSKRYTRKELLDLVEQKEFKVKAQEQSRNELDQRQNQAGFTYGDEQEYFFMNIAATTGAGKITPRRQHSSRDDIGHVRGSIITPNVNSPYSSSGAITDFNNVTENKPFLLAEEFQSDLYQKGYKKTNPKFMQKAIETYYGGLSKESQKVIADSSLAANKINLPAVNDYGYIRNNTMILTDEAIERTMKDATERGYIGGDTFDSINFSVDRLKGVETDEVFKPAYLDTKRIENTVRMLAEKGVSINLPETEVFRAEMFVPPSVDVETVFKVDPLSLSNSSFIADQSTFFNSNPQVLSRVQSMDPDTAEIFNTTTVGELNAATKEWLESLSMSAQSQGFVPSLIEDIVRNETNAERMGRGDFISADDIGGRSGGTIGEPGTISEVAENLVRKKLRLSLNDESGYPDDINSYFKLINAYSDLIYQQVSFPNDTVNVLGKLSVTKKTDDKQIKKLEDYITKTTQGILDYRTKIVDQENEIDKHFEKFVGKLDDDEEAAAQLTPEQAKALRRSAIDGLREAYKGLKRNTNDFQGLDAVTPPIKQVKSVTDEMLKILIVKAATSGVDKIVIPPTDRIAAIRFRDHRAAPKKFTQLYDEGIPASIQELKQNYPEVIVTRDVEMPYDNSMYPPGYTDIPSNQGTVIDLEAFFKKYDVSPDGSVRQFAQGGVAMKDQMEMMFDSEADETVDSVSGNDVPPGSLPEEVRDDIPARLSEGEYVVPADVVRYYGVKFFEDLRMQAKMGLQQMDADGRIGGEPQQAEMTDEDLNSIIEQAMQQEQPMMANEGGVVGRRGVGSSYGGRNLSYGTPVISAKDVVPEIETPEDIAKKLPEVVKPVQAASAGFTGTKTYYNSKGMPVSIQFINGQPQQSLEGLTEKNPFDEGPSLPAGFTSQIDFELAVAKGEINPITGLRWSSSKEKEIELQGRAKLVNENLNFKEPQKTLNWARDTIEGGSTKDSIGFKTLGGIAKVLGAGAGSGLIGIGANLITKGRNIATVRAAAKIAEERGFTDLSQSLYNLKGVGEKEKGIASGNSYADDIRKAATQITRTGKEGDKEGLVREDFAPGKLGQKKFDESMQDSAPTGYVYVPSATTFIPSSTSLVETSVGNMLEPVEVTTPSSTVTSLGSYKPKDDYVVGRVGGSPTGKIIRPRLRPTKPGDGDGPPPSNVKTPGYVTNAVDRNGNRIQDGTGLAKPDTTYTRANPKPGSLQDKENKGDDGSNDKSIVCTEMYRQTQLADWSKAMKTWDIYQKKYLTPAHEIGYHWLFKPYVKGMQKNNTLTKLGAYLAKERTQHLRHILTKGKAKDSLVGKVWCSIIHPVVYAAGKIKGEA